MTYTTYFTAMYREKRYSNGKMGSNNRYISYSNGGVRMDSTGG